MAGYAFFLTVAAAAMTAFYSWRQFLMTFHGRYRGADDQAGPNYTGQPAVNSYYD